MPHINEPEPYTEITPRPRLEQWNSDAEYRQRMIQALLRQDFKNVRIATESDRLIVVLTNARISEMSRAVGRAARTIVALAPIETREIKITYTVNDLPFATYEFVDVQRLQRYFNGQIGRAELDDYVNVTYAQPGSEDVAREKRKSSSRWTTSASRRSSTSPKATSTVFARNPVRCPGSRSAPDSACT